jgi:hypothetical protein
MLPMIGHAQSGCVIITTDEAATVLGGRPTRTEEGGACGYELPGGLAALSVVLQGGGEFVFTDSRKEFVGKNAIVKDEPSIGLPAFSFIFPAQPQGRSSGFFVRKGSGVLMVFIVEKKPGAIRSAEKLDRLRPIIRKAISRF